MKHLSLFFISVLLLTVAGCRPEDDIYPVNQDAFGGYYVPQAPIASIRHDCTKRGWRQVSTP